MDSELSLFVLLFEIDRLIYMLGSRSNNVIPETSNKHVQAIIRDLSHKRENAFTQLDTFGVSYLKEGENKTNEFRAWYKWWKDYVFSLPEDLQIKIFKNSDEIKSLRPSGSWSDLVGKC